MKKKKGSIVIYTNDIVCKAIQMSITTVLASMKSEKVRLQWLNSLIYELKTKKTKQDHDLDM